MVTSLITGTVLQASGEPLVSAEVQFVPQKTPYVSGSEIITSAVVSVTTDALGVLPTLNLGYGDYLVRINNTDAFTIAVPNDGASHTLVSLLTTELPIISATPSAIIVDVAALSAVLGSSSSMRYSRSGDPEGARERVAIIGNYGLDSATEASVAATVLRWAPTMLVSAGNNNYPSGASGTIDDNVGKYFRTLLSPYTGSYGSGSADGNKFLAVPGSVDWGNEIGGSANLDAFTSFFTQWDQNSATRQSQYLGGAEFFFIDSDKNAVDGFLNNSVQAQNLQTKLAASTARFKVVVFNHAPYSSAAGYTDTWMADWDFASWGADVVITSGPAVYERLLIDGVLYLNVGNGGAQALGSFSAAVTGSEARYADEYGSLLLEINDYSIRGRFVVVTGEIVDTFEFVSSQTNILTGSVRLAPNGGLMHTPEGLAVNFRHLSFINSILPQAVKNWPLQTGGSGGSSGSSGTSSYVYIGYASSSLGAGFTTTFNSSLDYIAFKVSATPILSPSAADFSGLWVKYKGQTLANFESSVYLDVNAAALSGQGLAAYDNLVDALTAATAMADLVTPNMLSGSETFSSPVSGRRLVTVTGLTIGRRYHIALGNADGASFSALFFPSITSSGVYTASSTTLKFYSMAIAPGTTFTGSLRDMTTAAKVAIRVGVGTFAPFKLNEAEEVTAQITNWDERVVITGLGPALSRISGFLVPTDGTPLSWTGEAYGVYFESLGANNTDAVAAGSPAVIQLTGNNVVVDHVYAHSGETHGGTVLLSGSGVTVNHLSINGTLSWDSLTLENNVYVKTVVNYAPSAGSQSLTGPINILSGARVDSFVIDGGGDCPAFTITIDKAFVGGFQVVSGSNAQVSPPSNITVTNSVIGDINLYAASPSGSVFGSLTLTDSVVGNLSMTTESVANYSLYAVRSQLGYISTSGTVSLKQSSSGYVDTTQCTADIAPGTVLLIDSSVSGYVVTSNDTTKDSGANVTAINSTVSGLVSTASAGGTNGNVSFTSSVIGGSLTTGVASGQAGNITLTQTSVTSYVMARSADNTSSSRTTVTLEHCRLSASLLTSHATDPEACARVISRFTRIFGYIEAVSLDSLLSDTIVNNTDIGHAAIDDITGSTSAVCATFTRCTFTSAGSYALASTGSSDRHILLVFCDHVAPLGDHIIVDSTTSGVSDLITGVRLESAPLALNTGTNFTCVSITLPPGEWDVEGVAYFKPDNAVTVSSVRAALDQNWDLGTTVPGRYATQLGPIPYSATVFQSVVTPTHRFVVTTPTLTFLGVVAVFSGGAISAFGFLRARRVK